MEIFAEGNTIRKILKKEISYEIPDYQRPYSWTPEKTDDLFNDV